MSKLRLTAILLFALFAAQIAQAAQCVNRFVSRTENNRQVVTLLTGKLTFQEAQALSKAIQAGTAPPLEWVNDAGKTLYKQIGELKVVRPMPVGCDGKTSGVVVIATFLTPLKPTKKLSMKLDPNTTVAFEQQTE